MTESLGSVNTTLKFQNKNFNVRFNVVEKLPAHIPGLLGTDFLLTHNANVDFNTLTLTLNHENGIDMCTIPLDIHDNFTCTIPARTEVVRYLRTDLEDTCVVLQQEIIPHVFIANSIAEPVNGTIPVRIVNLKNKPVKVENFKANIKPASLYYITELEQTKNNKNQERAEKLLSELNLTHLPTEEKQLISKICLKYSDVFCLQGDRLETTQVYCPSISVKASTQPVYSKPYRLPVSQKTEVDRHIDNMLQDGIIEKAKSEWNSPILLVPKKSSTDDKKWRLVIDYRKLNNVLEDDKFPLPNIEDIIDSLAGAKYFSHLDLSQGYYQCKLKPEDRHVTAFSTPTGQYQMTRLPMGLKTSPSSFSRLMTVAMSGLNLYKCLIYLDDIIIFGRTLEEHNKNLISVFQRLREVNLKLNPLKCNFLKEELLYLGHYISAEGIKPDPAKIEAVKQWPIPSNADEIKRFVAFANYYRKHIKDFAKLCAPLNKLTRKDIKFEWSSQCQESFEELKQSFIKPPVLDYPDLRESNIFNLHTDASGYAIGAVLSNSNGKPVAYASKSLNKAESNYSTIEKELLAMVWAIKHFRPYLYGRRFEVYSDHRPLVYLFTLADPSSRLTKFRLALEEYNFEVIYRKGSENVIADALSRISIQDLKILYEKTVLVITRASKRKDEKGTDVRTDQPTSEPEKYITLTVNDNLKSIQFSQNKIEIPTKRTQIDLRAMLSKVVEYSKKNEIKYLIIKNEKKCHDIIKEYEELQQYGRPTFKKATPKLIKLGEKIKVIEDEKTKLLILNDYHLLPTAGHAGMRRTLATISKKYFWKNMKLDVENFIKKCKQCQIFKVGRCEKPQMTVTTTASSAFEKIYMDLVGPLIPANGCEYILTTQCELTKFITATPIPNKTTDTVAKAFVEDIILKYGVPQRIASDRGTEFMSSLFTSIAKQLNIQKLNSTAYHHETIGSLENTHKCLGNFLRIYCNEKLFSWVHWIPFYTFAYNNTIHTNTKYTPFYLVFGKNSNMPSNLTNDTPEPIYDIDDYSKQLKLKLQVCHKEIRENLLSTKIKRTSKNNLGIVPKFYEEDDLILLKNETGRKLDRKFTGPYRVVEDMGPNIKVLINGKEDVVHKDRVKNYND